MANNLGRLNEDELLINLNGKRIDELNYNLRALISDLFGPLDINGILKCWQPDEYIKPDLIIEYNGQKKGLSIKGGASDQVHRESITTFVDFLKNNGVSQRTINTILLFQYGDDTLDGTGKKRMPYSVIQYRYKARIREANIELNKNKDLILKVIQRAVFDGVIAESEKADAIYHGDVFEGKAVTRYQVQKYILKKDWDKYDHLHIGPLFIGPHARYVEGEIKNEKYRHQITIRWHGIILDIAYIHRNFFSYTPLNKRKY